MNENDLARRIVEHLDDTLGHLPAGTAEKLQAARMSALARARGGSAAARSPVLALIGWGSGRALAMRLVLPVAIVIASLTGLLYWQMSPSHEDELEAGLLAGELPIHAYIDPGFETWLQDASHTPQQQ
jgi:hypothetical protein